MIKFMLMNLYRKLTPRLPFVNQKSNLKKNLPVADLHHNLHQMRDRYSLSEDLDHLRLPL
jgi:hypothetical protein